MRSSLDLEMPRDDQTASIFTINKDHHIRYGIIEEILKWEPILWRHAPYCTLPGATKIAHNT